MDGVLGCLEIRLCLEDTIECLTRRVARRLDDGATLLPGCDIGIAPGPRCGNGGGRRHRGELGRVLCRLAHTTPRVASLLGCGVITGVGAAINTTQIKPGASAVVIGTGGVGLNVIQGAALSGANPLIAIDVNDAKLSAARAFGATHVINSKNQDAAAVVRELTNGRMADHVFVSVGVGPAIEQGIGLMGKGAETIIVGMPPSGVTTTFDPSWLAADSQRIIGSKMGSAQSPADIPQLVGLYRGGRLLLDELITKRYPLEEINEAIDAVKRGEALRNVVVF